MQQDLSRFTDIVKASKLLNTEQKRELLDNPALLPAAYRERIAGILTRYDERARAREEQVGQRLQDATKQFAQTLDEAGVPPDEKQALLEKARQHTATLIRSAPAS